MDKKSNDKNTTIRIVIIIIVVSLSILFLIGCSLLGFLLDLDTTKSETPILTPTLTPTPTPSNWEELYYTNYKDLFDKVEYDKEFASYLFYPNKETQNSIKKMQVGDELLLKSWYKIVEDFKKKSFDNKHSLYIVNPFNDENILLIVMNGEVLFSEF